MVVSCSQISDNSTGIWHYTCHKCQSLLQHHQLQPKPLHSDIGGFPIRKSRWPCGRQGPWRWQCNSLSCHLMTRIFYLLRYLTQPGLGMGVTSLKACSPVCSHPCWMRKLHEVVWRLLYQHHFTWQAGHKTPEAACRPHCSFLAVSCQASQQLRGKFKFMLPEQKQQGKPLQTGQKSTSHFWKGGRQTIWGFQSLKMNSWNITCLGTCFLNLPNISCVTRCLIC